MQYVRMTKNVVSVSRSLKNDQDSKVLVKAETEENQDHFPAYRLRVVPLSLCSSCVTRTKTARKKWPREILVVRSTRKEGLPSKPKSLNYALLSQRKNMIGSC